MEAINILLILHDTTANKEIIIQYLSIVYLQDIKRTVWKSSALGSLKNNEDMKGFY